MKYLAYIYLMGALLINSCNSPQNEITVMTFNIRMDTSADGINRWEARVPVVNSYLDSVAPDIIGMQEVLHNQIIDLSDMLPGYIYVGTGRDDGRESGEYSPLFFREGRFNLKDNSQFWLSESPDEPGSRSWDAAITRIVTWAMLEDKKSGEIFYVFNTHFDHRGVEARLRSSDLISQKIAEIAGNSRVILTGDFNIRKNSEDYGYMADVFKDRGLTNSELISEKPVNGGITTFNGFRMDMEPGIIDFIFVSEGFQVNSYRVDEVIENDVFLSDHWPVVTEVTYSGQPK
jgi:endonuclease/exonuclease/phosphatase family metal-dependent hydrolase